MVETLTVVALILWIVLSLCVLAGLAYSLPTFRKLRVNLDRLDRLLAEAEGRLGPALDSLRRASEDAEYIAAAIRSDVDELGETAGRANRSVRRIVEMAEKRASEIHAFLDIVQEEAEDTFVSTASLLRALRGIGRRGRTGERDRRSA